MEKELQKRIYSSIIIIPFSLFFLIKGSIFFTFFLSILFLVTSYEWIILCKKNPIGKILGIIFLLFSFYSAHQIRDLLGINSFILVIFICVFTDTGGYIFGKFFKGPKLIKISPNKTYAGVLGGFLLAIISGLVFENFYSTDIHTYLEIFISHSVETQLLIFVLIISLVSQIGDLIVSYFKRLAKVKDTGKIIPGHGGILDRIDGLIFAIPISYLILIL
tara:strand:- start:205 stop:861 length:657 start_codon:yes stop_codon:yes gene_type:complete